MIKRKIIDPLIGFLKQGVSPASLALAITVSVVIAYIPVFGISTLLCLLAVWLFRLNPAVVLLVNQIAYPLQFIFFVPLLRTGEWLFRPSSVPSRLPESVSQILTMAKENLSSVISLLWQSTLYAMVVWVLISIPIALILFYTLKTVIAKFNAQLISRPS